MQRFYSALLLLAILVFTACDNDSLTKTFTTGEDFTQSNINIIQIDTFTMKMSTFKFDSITSEGNSRILVGRYTDPAFGIVKAAGFVDYMPSTYTIDQLAVFDSVVLNLPYGNFYYNDTLARKTIKVQELTKEIRFKNNQYYFYNTSTVTASATVIGQKTFLPRISKDSLTVTLSNAFGQNLFSKLKSHIINDQEQFTDYFKGIKISADDSEDASIIGFNAATSYIRLYYTMPEATSSNYIDLVYNSYAGVQKFFSHIEGDRNGTLLQAIGGNQENELASAATNNLCYIQSGIGITTKITFPNLRNISTINDNKGSIFKANVRLKISKQYYNDNMYPGDSLYVYVVDQNNDLVAPLADAAGNNVIGYIDYATAETNDVYITAPVETYLEKVLNDNLYLKYGLIFLPKDFNSSTKRLILNGENNSEYKSRLELTYITYDK